MPAPGSIVEIAISNGGYGGDFLLDDTGDLVLSIDTPSDPQATIDRLTRLILTNANVTDGNGNVIGYADDIFHPTWGASVRAYIGENFTDAIAQTITTKIRAQLAEDPMVADSAPVLTQTAPNTVAIVVTFSTTDGQTAVLPTIALTPNGAFVSGATA
jgi:hypothetical protein